MIEFATKVRAFIDTLLRTPYLRWLELELERVRQDGVERLAAKEKEWAALQYSYDQRVAEKDAGYDALLMELRIQIEKDEIAAQQLRQDLNERLKDKDAMIADLRLQRAVAETGLLREKTVQAQRAAKPVPDFGGPVPFQDDLARMSNEVETKNAEPEEMTNAV